MELAVRVRLANPARFAILSRRDGWQLLITPGKDEAVAFRRVLYSAASFSGSTMLLSGTLLLVFGPGALIPATAASLLGGGLGIGGGLILLRGWLVST